MILSGAGPASDSDPTASLFRARAASTAVLLESDSDSDDSPSPPHSAAEYEISEASRLARERQDKILQDHLMKRHALSMSVPTKDAEVRARLRRVRWSAVTACALLWSAFTLRAISIAFSRPMTRIRRPPLQRILMKSCGSLWIKQDRPLSGCSFSQDGSMLATSSSSGTAKVRRMSQVTEVATLKGHRERVTDLSFSSMKDLLATLLLIMLQNYGFQMVPC